jgi:hypothetical protein
MSQSAIAAFTWTDEPGSGWERNCTFMAWSP